MDFSNDYTSRSRLKQERIHRAAGKGAPAADRTVIGTTPGEWSLEQRPEEKRLEVILHEASTLANVGSKLMKIDEKKKKKREN